MRSIVAFISATGGSSGSGDEVAGAADDSGGASGPAILTARFMAILSLTKGVLPGPRRLIAWALLLGCLSSCGGSDSPVPGLQTCFQLLITYNGSKSGAANLRMTVSEGGGLSENSPSIQDLIFAETGALHCVTFFTPHDRTYAAVAWMDVTGTEATACSDLANPQCQPSPTDPQAHQSGVQRYGQTTQVHLDLVDPP